MHRSRVSSQEQGALLQESPQLPQGNLAGEYLDITAVPVLHLGNAVLHQLRVHRTAKKGNAVALCQKLICTAGKIGINPPLRLPAGTDIEGHHLLIRSKILLPDFSRTPDRRLRQPHLQSAIVNPVNAHGLLQHIKVGMNLMLDRLQIWQHLVKKQGKARLGVAHNPVSAAEGRNSGSPLVAMEINHQIKLFLSYAPNVFNKGRQAVIPALLVNQQAFINMPVILHQICQLLICQQGNPCLGIVGAQGSQHRRHQHQVTDVHQVYHQYILVVPCNAHAFVFTFSNGWIEASASSTIFALMRSMQRLPLHSPLPQQGEQLSAR